MCVCGANVLAWAVMCMRLFSLYPSICSNVPFLCLVISLVEWQNSPACLRQQKKQRNLVTQFDLAATFVLFLSGNKSCVYFLFWSFKASNICSEIITLGAFICFPVNSILYLITVFISLLGYTILLLVLNFNWRNFVHILICLSAMSHPFISGNKVAPIFCSTVWYIW